MLKIISSEAFESFARRKSLRLGEAEETVAPILEDIRKRGDAALRDYARKFDGFDEAEFAVPRAALAEAAGHLTPAIRSAIETASANIREYAQTQLPVECMRTLPGGRRLGQIVRPLDSMGAYIPAGRYPLPSTLLMTAIPAQVAGVKTICVACPKPSLEILGAAHLLNVDLVYRMGGAHAIAAFAFGTETIPKVDRIVGPGSIYVAAAKRLLAGETGIDFVAGPTEIVIIAEEGDPRHLAADLLAQAEHDVDASAILLTNSLALAEEVSLEVNRQLETLPTAAVAGTSISNNSACVIVENLEEAVELSNHFAPEHLSIPDAKLLALVRHAGSVFIGPYSPEAAGDYASGPNHVLPTAGAARIRGGLSAADFVKVISVQELSREGLRGLAPSILALARAEGLEAHARSVEVRLAP
jgi:histidinol dehydrogenase